MGREGAQALTFAALHFGRAVDPCTRIERAYEAAKQAVDAGCDDPLVLYLYARCSSGPNLPDRKELERRILKAAHALERSPYPPLWRASAMSEAGQVLAVKPTSTAAERKEAGRLLDATLDLVLKEADQGGHDFDGKQRWFSIAGEVLEGRKRLDKDDLKAYERVDAALAKAPRWRPCACNCGAISTRIMRGRPAAPTWRRTSSPRASA